MNQQLGQCNTATLATRKRTNLLLPVEVIQQTSDDIANLCVAGPLVLWHVANYGLPDGLTRVDHICLVEKTDGEPVAMGDSTFIWREASV